jgi:hypothetical protein
MRSLLVFFAILLAILTLISSLGGSLSAKETFYTEQPIEDAEGWQDATPEVASEMKQETYEEESSEMTPPPPITESFEDAVPAEEVEPFEADENMHAAF